MPAFADSSMQREIEVAPYPDRRNMNMANDIANLLRRFGANVDGYHEVESTIDYKELPLAPVVVPVASVNPPDSANETANAPSVRVENIDPAPMAVAAVSTLRLMPERIEPVMSDAPVVPGAANTSPSPTSSDPVMLSSLRSLLSEVALKRQAEARARTEVTSPQPSINDLPSITPAQVIAVVSPKGGVGKSTICAALAGSLNPKGRVIAIDLDPQNALQYHMDVNSEGGDASDAGVTGESWNALLRDGVCGTHVLSYGSFSEKDRRALERRLEEDNHWLSKQLARMNLNANDVVILDTPPGRTLYLDQALDVADQVIVVVTPDASSFMALDQIDRLLDGRANGDRSYIVNQFDASRPFCQDMLEILKRRFGTKLIGVIPLDHAISEGLAFGLNPLLQTEESPARQEVLSICDALKSQVGTTALLGDCAS